MTMHIWDGWGPGHPPPRPGQNRQTYRTPKSNTNMKGRGGGGKPPKPPNKGCGKKAALLLIGGVISAATVGNAIWQSLT